MYLSKKSLIIVLIFMFVAISWADGDKGKKRGIGGEPVEEIYDRIRAAGPQYEWEERNVTFMNEGMNLIGTLVTPKGIRKPPVVITLNGFAEDRFYKEIPNTGGEYFYPRLSRILAEQGIATLRVDYRGSGDSDGDYTMTTFSTQISDALAAVEHICSKLRRTVDWKNIGMLGFSQGGLVTSVASSMDERIDSIVLWSAVANPFLTYSSLLPLDGIKQGLALPDGGTITLPIYVGDWYLGDIDLGKGFFQDMILVTPPAAIRGYQGPMLYVAGIRDILVWPQPQAGQTFLNYHEGYEKLVVLDGDHEFDSDYSFEVFDEAVYWAAAWFIKTLD